MTQLFFWSKARYTGILANARGYKLNGLLNEDKALASKFSESLRKADNQNIFINLFLNTGA